jgi:hypothetical protein
LCSGEITLSARAGVQYLYVHSDAFLRIGY